VARVDVRMDADGRIYVLEVNPLPGLTPGYSDLVLIAQAIGIQYDQLIAEIMAGGLRRMREKRREERESDKKEAAKAASDVAAKYEKAADKVAADKTAKRMPRPPFEKPRDERRPAVRTDGAPLSQSSDGDSDRNVVAVPTPPPTTH
jgi:hypothetical protein